ncbi:MAG: hypothetical protein J5533_06060 [Bacteroidales bacterium]|nr:hypothetical protein [Bacteroidales bacterium]
MTLGERIYLTWNYGKAQLLMGGIYNVACTMLAANSFAYALLVDVFILKALFTAVVLYLVHHFRDRGACFFYINLGLSRRKLLISVILIDFLALALMLTIVLLIHG